MENYGVIRELEGTFEEEGLEDGLDEEGGLGVRGNGGEVVFWGEMEGDYGVVVFKIALLLVLEVLLCFPHIIRRIDLSFRLLWMCIIYISFITHLNPLFFQYIFVVLGFLSSKKLFDHDIFIHVIKLDVYIFR